MNNSEAALVSESRDGTGASDNDLPYEFGHRPTVSAPAPFTTHEYARLLILRSRVEAEGAN